MSIKDEKTIYAMRAKILNTRIPVKPKELAMYEAAINHLTKDNIMETMFLYAVEALKDDMGLPNDECHRIAYAIDSRMHEWTDNPNFNIDDLRLRVFQKVEFMFACSEEDEEHIVQLLRDAGHEVLTRSEIEIYDVIKLYAEEPQASNIFRALVYEGNIHKFADLAAHDAAYYLRVKGIGEKAVPVLEKVIDEYRRCQ